MKFQGRLYAAFFLSEIPFGLGGRAGFTGAPFQPRQQVTFAIADFASDLHKGKVVPSGGSPDRESSGGNVENVSGGLVVAQVADVGRDDFGGHDMRSSKPRMVAVWNAFCGYGGSVDNSTGYMRITLC